jgi:hypothetical protein
VGFTAGQNLTTGSNNIDIYDAGLAGESNTIRIGTAGTQTATFIAGINGVAVAGTPVVVSASGQLGVAPAGSPLSANELLKQQRVVQELKATTERQAARIVLQEGQIKTLTTALTTALKQQAEQITALKQQAEQIQKVSAQLEMIRPTPRVVNNP